MAGDALLVPATPEPGESSVRTRLPAGTSWYDPVSGLVHNGGHELTIEYPLRGEARWLVRCGSFVPVNEGKPRLSGGYFDDVCFLVYPPADSAQAVPGATAAEADYSEDDGERDFLPGSHNAYRLALIVGGDDSYRGSLAAFAVADAAPDRTRVFRFRVPSGFTVRDAAGRALGHEYRAEFSGVCGDIEFFVSGSYAQGRHP